MKLITARLPAAEAELRDGPRGNEPKGSIHRSRHARGHKTEPNGMPCGLAGEIGEIGTQTILERKPEHSANRNDDQYSREEKVSALTAARRAGRPAMDCRGEAAFMPWCVRGG